MAMSLTYRVTGSHSANACRQRTMPLKASRATSDHLPGRNGFSTVARSSIVNSRPPDDTMLTTVGIDMCDRLQRGSVTH